MSELIAIVYPTDAEGKLRAQVAGFDEPPPISESARTIQAGVS